MGTDNQLQHTLLIETSNVIMTEDKGILIGTKAQQL